MGGGWSWLTALLAVVTLATVGTAQELLSPPSVSCPPEPASLDKPDVFYAARTDPEVKGLFSGLQFNGEFLFLRPHRDGLETALLSNGPASAVDSLSWSNTPGFRAGASYRSPSSDWDFSAGFTYFHAKSQRTVSAADNETLLGLLTSNPAAKNATDADGDAGLGYAVIDLDLGRNIRFDDCLNMRLFGGVRLASIDQSLKCIYSGGALGDSADYVNCPVKFQGAGLSAGSEVTWNLWKGWGVYGKGRFALIEGQFKSQRSETVGDLLVSDMHDKFETLVPVAELGVGMGYQGPHFILRVGYELVDWFDTIGSLAPAGASGTLPVRQRGDLTLEAVSIKAAFTF